MKTTRYLHVGLALLAAVMLAAPAAALEPESKRMAQAKDLIADERWDAAVTVLKAAADDPKEPNRDEALFWLAHSQNQVRDTSGALGTIRRLEREFRSSRWVKPARSLRVEIAQRLGRSDVLWYTAAPPAPPAPPAGPTPAVVAPAPAPAPRIRRAPLPPPPAAAPDAPAAPHPAPAALPTPTVPPPPAAWMPEFYVPDTDLRIQALGSLINVDAERAIPLLREIALESESVVEARRALFVLAHSGQPRARSTVVEVAKTAAEPVRIAAVRELGRVVWPGVQNELVSVYRASNARVKDEVVDALIAIVERERDPAVRREVLERLRRLDTPRAKQYVEKARQKR